MIGRLTGILAEKSPPQLLVDVNGVGYEVDVPMSTFYNLPALGERVTLLTHFVVREDAQVLFGFLTHDERATFRQLVKIQEGISTEKGREIVKIIKDKKLKVQAQIMDDQVRVTGKSRDDLQSVIQELRSRDLGIELQFVNMRD